MMPVVWERRKGVPTLIYVQRRKGNESGSNLGRNI